MNTNEEEKKAVNGLLASYSISPTTELFVDAWKRFKIATEGYIHALETLWGEELGEQIFDSQSELFEAVEGAIKKSFLESTQEYMADLKGNTI